VGDQLAEVEGHLGPGLAHAHFATVPGGLQRQVHAATLPGFAQLVGRHGHGAEGGGGLALEEAKALGQFIRDQVAQAHIVGQHDQAHTVNGVIGAGLHGHITGDDGDLGLEVDAKGFVGADHWVARADEVVTAALVHQGVGVKTAGHFRVARCAHQLHMVEVGRAVGPLVGSRQRGHALLRIERKSMARLALVERGVEVFQLGGQKVPVVQHLLHFGGDTGRIMGHAQVARNHHQLTVP
jgi:hypothetical protein